jgi:hypothetical protein
VQIDETKLNHNVKSYRGRAPVRPDWAITMVDISTTSAKGYAEVIPDRSTATMKPIIEKVREEHIYKQINEKPMILDRENTYTHSKIAHKFNFVDPVAGVYTQNVETIIIRLNVT